MMRCMISSYLFLEEICISELETTNPNTFSGGVFQKHFPKHTTTLMHRRIYCKKMNELPSVYIVDFRKKKEDKKEKKILKYMNKKNK